MAKEQSKEPGAALEEAMDAQELETKRQGSTVKVEPDEDGDGHTYTLRTSVPPDIVKRAKNPESKKKKVHVQWWLVRREDADMQHPVLRTQAIEVPRELFLTTEECEHEEEPFEPEATQGFLAASAENPLVATLDVTDLPQGDYDVIAQVSMED